MTIRNLFIWKLFFLCGLLVILVGFYSMSFGQEGGSFSFAMDFVKAAKERTNHHVTYDGTYHSIPYPLGDVPNGIGVCTDVVIRTYRKLGIDLQQLVHEDKLAHFSTYPNNWGLHKPDANIDHRRVPNLQTFLARHGTILPVSLNASDYAAGDLVTWTIANHLPHIGIVIDQFTLETNQPLRVHNMGKGPLQEDILFSFPITSHFRYGHQSTTRPPVPNHKHHYVR